MYKWTLLVSLLSFTAVNGVIHGFDRDKYGHYNVQIKSIETCEGDYKHSLGECSATTYRDERGHEILTGNFTATENVKVPKNKLQVYMLAEQEYRFVWENSIFNLCEDTFFATNFHILAINFKTIDGECIIEKGTTIFTADPISFARSALGNKYYYGTFKLHFNFYNDDANLCCMNIITELEKASN